MNIQAAHPEIFFLGTFAIMVAAAAFTDIKHRLIPNTLCLIIAALWVPYAIFMTGDFLYPFITAFIILVLGIAAFSRGFLGGGDAKLLAVCALWMGSEQILPFLFQTALAGGAMAILWRFEAPVRLALARGGLDVQVVVTRELPYGLAIAVGALLAAARMAGIS
ncbi:pilus assembly protein CpaA [Hwanghaeella grinnelliae]|uniref:Pilus assembly protein CpaA n=1 Tax=Hwanghaeella grinnelliae TaxID=2500179 RepID=A0A437QL04_9PROT|nr:prepilin peptidase [Hwanghaeella grinnelliae]RVU35190.1 pilus assembly protein CpaA [Hwanghaeella grinnelliae]